MQQSRHPMVMKQHLGLAIATLTLSLLGGCRGTVESSVPPAVAPEGAVASPAAPSNLPEAAPVTAAPAAPAAPDGAAIYQRGLEQATNAANLSQRARSRDDWRLAEALWQQAIASMAAVPQGAETHAQAQTKVGEYRRNLAIAQERANRPVQPAPTRTTPVAPAAAPAPAVAAATAPAPPGNAPTTLPRPQTGSSFTVPIVRRAGGTPVINVTFNGNRQYQMILDTGASGTVITQPMAAALGVVPVGQARVNTASAQNVTFPLGYLSSMEVGGAIARNPLVAVAGPNLNIGLLGQDFFQNYDVTIRQEEVEFRTR